MRTWIRASALALGAIFFQSGCFAPSSAKSVAFKGTWKVIQENGISGAKSEATVVVTADKDKFSIVQQADRSETTTVYNGDFLYAKSSYTGPPAMDPAAAPDPSGAVPAGFTPTATDSPVRSEKPNEAQLNLMRFWAKSYLGKAGPGGKIAGRDTLLYQAREKRPDGEITIQAWLDQETGIVLKSVLTIYSSQVDSMVSKATEECQQIDFGPVDGTAFLKP